MGHRCGVRLGHHRRIIHDARGVDDPVQRPEFRPHLPHRSRNRAAVGNIGDNQHDVCAELAQVTNPQNAFRKTAGRAFRKNLVPTAFGRHCFAPHQRNSHPLGTSKMGGNAWIS